MGDIKSDDVRSTSQDVDEDGDGWIDILGTGAFKKKYIKKSVVEGRPTDGDIVRIKAVGTLENGTIVEELDDLEFSVGSGEVIDGLELGVKLMDKGEHSEIFMESRFAYGEVGKDDTIPPNSNLIYSIELLDFSPEEPPEEIPIETRRDIGNRKRERGNWWFNRGDYRRAIQCYKSAIDFLDDTSDPYGETTSPLVKNVFEDRLKAQNNMAAAQMKIEAYDSALLSLNPVLRCQPDNVKALYRKAKILRIQGNYKEGLATISQALIIEPDNRLFVSEMSLLKEKLKEQTDSEKSLYKRMLGIKTTPEEKKDRYPTVKGDSLKVLLISFVALFVIGMVIRMFIQWMN